MVSLHDVACVVRTVAEGAYEALLENVLINLRERVFRNKPRVPDYDLAGKVCVVTGGNSGIGFAGARELAARGAHVIIACRSAERAQAAVQELQRTPPVPGCSLGSVEAAALDLADLASVRRFAQGFNARALPLHVLACNAGVMSPPERLTSADGHELQFQVNFLGHWLLARLLVGEQRRRRLCSASGSSDGTRVVFLSSMTHLCGRIKWDDLQSKRSYHPFTSYAASKLLSVIAAKDLHARFTRHPEAGSDSALALHPGIVRTDLSHGFFARTCDALLPRPLAVAVQALLVALSSIGLLHVEHAGVTLLHACGADSALVGGEYLRRRRKGNADEWTDLPQRQGNIWSLACSLTGLDTPEHLS